MLNIEKYKGEMLSALENGDDLQQAICGAYYDANRNGAFERELLNWLCEEYKEPILDEEEKKYLSAVIKPFRKEDIEITITKKGYVNEDYLEISIQRMHDFETTMEFPPYEEGTMYKNMVLNKKYTLEELGL